jgi:hypothetical protein
MKVTHVGGLQLPESAILGLIEAERQENTEQRADATRKMNFADACEVLAPQIHAEMAQRMLQAEAEARRQDDKARRHRQRREGQLEDLRASMMAQGRRWRTVPEVLAELQGLPL